jgi:hypothetical protein
MTKQVAIHTPEHYTKYLKSINKTTTRPITKQNQKTQAQKNQPQAGFLIQTNKRNG